MKVQTIALVMAIGGLIGLGGFLISPMADNFLAEPADPQQFVKVTDDIGFDHFPVRELYSAPGSGRQGAYVLDYNNDNWQDLLIVGGEQSPTIYENTGGQFERAGSIPRTIRQDTVFKGALVFDYDNDGWDDIYLLRPHPEASIFLENRNGTYHRTDVGLTQYFQMPNGATVIDYNQDGCLDVFVYQNGNWGDRNPVAYSNPNATITEDNGNQNHLYRGDCETFERVDDAGISGNHWSLAASVADFDGNGYPDIHVANDFYNDTIYFNEGNGTFDRRNLSANTNRNGMASEVADVNGDGLPDIFVTNIRIPSFDSCRMMVPTNNCSNVGAYIQRYVGDRNLGNNLLINQGDRTFSDQGDEYNVTFGGWGWAASVNDFDNDGDLDLFHTTERLSFDSGDNLTTPMFYERITQTSFTQRNATKLGFEAMSGRGVATLDYNRDGKLDLVVVEHPSSSAFWIHAYKNEWQQSGNWIQLSIGKPPEGPVFGTRVEITTENRTIVRRVNPRTDFFSQDSRVIHVGLGEQETIKEVKVEWPDGTVRKYKNIDVNKRFKITQTGLSVVED